MDGGYLDFLYKKDDNYHRLMFSRNDQVTLRSVIHHLEDLNARHVTDGHYDRPGQMGRPS